MTILVVGGGKMGMSHLALLSRYVGKNNVVLCDTKLSTRVLFRLLGYKVFSDVETAASAVRSLRGVVIATPTPSHAKLAKWAISKSVPCFIEKPLTLDVAKSAELILLAAAQNVPVQVGFVLRYIASFQRLRHLVQSKALGAMFGYAASMRGNVIQRSPAADSWQGQFMMGGGCLNEYGPHIIDLCQFIFGPVEQVGDVKITRVFCANADDRTDIRWSHKNGNAGEIEIDWCDNSKRKSVVEFKVSFEYAEVRVDNSAVDITWHEQCPLSDDQRKEVDVPICPSNVAYYLRGEEFSLELEEFLGTCAGREVAVDNSIFTDTAARLEDGYEVDRLIDEIARKAGMK